MLKKKVIGIVLTQKMADERYVKKDEPGPTPTPSVSITVSPQSINKDEATTMTIQVTSSQTSSNVKVKRNGTEVQGSYAEGTVWNFTDTFTPTAEGTVTYTAEVMIGSETKTASTTVTVVTPAPPYHNEETIFYGFAGNDLSGVTGLTSEDVQVPRDIPGTITRTVANGTAGYSFYIAVPDGWSLQQITQNGFTFPMGTAEAITVDGLNYKRYKSSEETGYIVKDYVLSITIEQSI